MSFFEFLSPDNEEQNKTKTSTPAMIDYEPPKPKELLWTQGPKTLSTGLSEIAEDPISYTPFLGGAKQAYDLSKIAKTSYDLFENKEVSEKDLYELQKYIADSQQDSTIGYKIIKGVAEIPSFAVELYATGGLYTAGKKATSKGIKEGLEKILSKEGKALVEKKLSEKLAGKATLQAGKLTSKIISGTAGATLQAPVAGSTRILAGTIEKMIPEMSLTEDDNGELSIMLQENGEDVYNAAIKAFGENWVEVTSERSGGLFSAVASPIRNKILKTTLVKQILKLNPNLKTSGIRKVINRIGWNGLLEEMAEERVADVGHGILNSVGLSDQQFQLPSMEQLAVEGAVLSTFGLSINVANEIQKKNTETKAINYMVDELGYEKNTAKQIYQSIQQAAESSKYESSSPDLKDVIDQVKIKNGILPDFYNQLIQEAEKKVISTDYTATRIFHQTDKDPNDIRSAGFVMGKNSKWGEAAWFGTEPNETYGENTLDFDARKFSFKTFRTQQEEDAYLKEQGETNLADAIRKEGEYDGFVLPQPKAADTVVAITNKEKLNAYLAKQITDMRRENFITSKEAEKEFRSFPFVRDLNLPLKFKNKILTYEGKYAYGKYSSAMVEFVNNPHKSTPSHEAVHAFIDLMTDSTQKRMILDEVKRRYSGKKLTDKQAEEIIADNFIKYARDGSAPSNRFKRFFEWLWDNIKKVVGANDKIKAFYKEVGTKRPTESQKIEAAKKMQKGLSGLADVRNEYYQEPQKLTTKFLENVDVKNRETASYQFLKNLLNSKSLPLKMAERDLISDILETQFKYEKKINMDDFRDAIISELLPLSAIESDSYAEYGLENIGRDMSEDGVSATTYILNSPLNHGIAGHFHSDFGNGIENANPANYPTTGLFSHFRSYDNDNDGSYITEIQSDVYQKEIPTKQEMIRKLEKEIARQERDLEDYGLFKQHDIIKSSMEADKRKLENIKSEKSKIFEEAFDSYRNTWHERTVREAIRIKAMEGFNRVFFPTPYTVAMIEGYLGQGQIPTATEVGQDFDYIGYDYTLLSKDGDGNHGKATDAQNIRNVADFDLIRDEEKENMREEINDDLDNFDYYIEKYSDYTTKELAKLKKEDSAKFDSVVDDMLERVIDSERFTDAESFVDYWEETTGEQDYAFATEDNQVIFVKDPTKVETLAIGSTGAEREGFNYEENEDLADEHKTVLRFYDKQVNKYLRKFRKENLELIDDENGYQWLATEIMPEDKEAVEAFQTMDSLSEEDPSEYIHKEDKKMMVEFIDYVRLKKDEDKDLEIAARHIAEGYGIFDYEKIDPTNRMIANAFDRVLTGIQKIAIIDNEKYQEITDDDKNLVLDLREAKKKADKIIEENTVKGNKNTKNVIRKNLGMTPEPRISKTEKQLLNMRIRATKNGYSMGKVDTRKTLNEAFRTKLDNLEDIKKSIVNYSKDLPNDVKARLLPIVQRAKTQKDLTKAYMRIDSYMDNVIIRDEAKKLSDKAKKVKLAVRTGRGIAVEYQKKINGILFDYDFKKPTANTIKRLSSMIDYAKENPGVIPEKTLEQAERLKKTPLSKLNSGGLKELNQLIDKLISNGKLLYKLRISSDQRRRDIEASKLASTTVNIEKYPKAQLEVLSPHRVANIMDGRQEFKGMHSQYTRRISSLVLKAYEERDVEMVELLGKLENVYKDLSIEDQQALSYYSALDQGKKFEAEFAAKAWGWENPPDRTDKIKEALDILRQVFKKTQNDIGALYERRENKPFEYVNNYLPIGYEKKVGEISEPTVGGNYIGRKSEVEQGFTEGRKQNVKKVLRSDFLSLISEEILKQRYYLNVQPELSEFTELINSNQYRAVAGEKNVQYWKDYIDAISNRGYLSRSENNAWLARRRINLSKAMLGYKATTVARQLDAIFDGMSYIQANYGSAASIELATRFATALIDPTYSYRARKRSAALRARHGGELSIREIDEMNSGTGILSKAYEVYQQTSLSPLKIMDMKTAAAVRNTVYSIVYSKTKDRELANKEADFVMNMTQGSSSVGDIPLVLMRGEVARTFLTFQTFVLNRWGIFSEDLIMSGIIKGNLVKKIRALTGMMILILGTTWWDEVVNELNQIIKGKKYKEKFNFIEKALLQVPEMIPVLGQFVRSTIEYNQEFSVPITQLGSNFVEGARDIFSEKEETRQKAALKLSESLASFFGVAGTSQFFDIAERQIFSEPEMLNSRNSNTRNTRSNSRNSRNTNNR